MKSLLAVFGLWAIMFAKAFSAEPLAINLADVDWGPPGGGNGVPLGTRTAQQRIDPETGGITYYAMFPAGTHFDRHWHTHDEFVSVMAGEVDLELGDETYRLEAGAYVVIPGGMNHSWDVPELGEVIILVVRSGPADFHFVD
jgi:quercetin dioxygenase-like cupin family protein